MIRTGTLYWFTCDRCGAESPARHSMVEASEAARATGWVLDGRHSCPKCGAKA